LCDRITFSIQQGRFAEWLANDPFQPDADGGVEERVYVVEQKESELIT
jgi:hypothetical protein